MVTVIVLLLFLAQATPALSAPALDTYPVAARESIAHTHAQAASRPNDAEAVGAFARALHAWEQWHAAHDAYARAATLSPKTFEFHYLDAVVLQRLAQHGDAAARLRTAVTLSAGYLPARVRLAEALLESGELAESKALFTALVNEPAATPAAEVGLGRIAAAQQQHREAIAHFQRAVSLFPELGAAYYALALSHRAIGNREDAQKALEQHRQYGPRWPALNDPVLANVSALREDAGAILQRGVRLADAGDVDAAIAAHETALARDPGLSQAHANLIALYGRARNWPKAEEHYRAAVASGVGLADVHYDYAVLMGLQEKWDLAENAYRRALSVNPMHAQAQNNLGQTLERQRRLTEAADCYRRAVESQPSFRLARFNYARMLIALTKPADAIAELEKIVEPRDAESPRYLFALGVAHVHAGRKEEGVALSMQAKTLALQFGQKDLAASIDRELKGFK